MELTDYINLMAATKPVAISGREQAYTALPPAQKASTAAHTRSERIEREQSSQKAVFSSGRMRQGRARRAEKAADYALKTATKEYEKSTEWVKPLVEAAMRELFGDLFDQHLPSILRELSANVEKPDEEHDYPLVAKLDEHMAYWGVDDAGTWSGNLFGHDGTLIHAWTLAEQDDIDALGGMYLHYDGKTKHYEINDSSGDELTYTWQICERNEEGKLFLSSKTTGDIRVPVPKEWDERQVLQTQKADGKLLFEDLTIKTDAPEVGFEFVKEGGGNELTQMKAVKATAGKVLVATGDGGAKWVEPELEVEAVGTALWVRLYLGESCFEASVDGRLCADD